MRVWLAISTAVATLGVACASAPRPAPHPALDPDWKQFLRMPKQRALAIAGDLDGVWVGTMASGQPSLTEVERSALDQCNRMRVYRGIESACFLYAVNDEIVWKAGPIH